MAYLEQNRPWKVRKILIIRLECNFNLLSLSCAFISDRNSQASFIFLVYLYLRNFENFLFFHKILYSIFCTFILRVALL